MGKSGGSIRTYQVTDGMGHVVRPTTNTLNHRQLPSENQIRLRLLNRLGIHQKKPPISAAPEHRRKHALHGNSSSNTTTTTTTITSTMRTAPAHFCLPLKDDSDDEMPGSPSSSEPTSPTSSSNASMSPYTMDLDRHQRLDKQKETQQATPTSSNNSNHNTCTTPPRRRIQFNTNVMVVPIPSRHAYSKRIRQAFWMDGAEIQATAERNRYEFASEGWDYQQVLEDEDMYMDVNTGQLVHPCWVEDEDDGEEGGYNNGATRNAQGDAPFQVQNTSKDEDQYLETKAPCLKRTASGVFEWKDAESGNEEKATEGAAATA